MPESGEGPRPDIQEQFDQHRADDDGMATFPDKPQSEPGDQKVWPLSPEKAASPAPIVEQPNPALAAPTEEPETGRPAIPEPAPHAEQEAKKEIEKFVTPEVSRIALSTVDAKYLNPEEKTVSPEEADALKTKKAEDIDYKAVSKLSAESRDKYWEEKAKEKDGPKTFKEQNKNWNEGVWGWVQESTAENADNRDERIAALQSVGIDARNTESDTDGLNKTVDNFRQEYFKGGTKVEKFVEDIAKDCKDEDGTVDLDKLQTRLDAVSDLFNAFGKDHSANELVKNYTKTYAVLSQNEATKQSLPAQASEAIKQPLSPEMQQAFAALHQKHGEAEKEEQFREAIKKKLDEARGNPEETETVGKAHDEESKVQHQYREGEITQQERNDKLAELQAKAKGIAEFSNEKEFEEALLQLKELGVYKSAEEAERDYKHEVAHYRQALEFAKDHKLDIPPPTFRIQVSKSRTGFTYHPSVHCPPPEDEEKAKQMQDEVIWAAKPYGLSGHDLQALGLDAEDIKDTDSLKDARKNKEKRLKTQPEEPEEEKKPDEKEPDEKETSESEQATTVTEDEQKLYESIKSKLREAISHPVTIDELKQLDQQGHDINEQHNSKEIDEQEREIRLKSVDVLVGNLIRGKGVPLETNEELQAAMRILQMEENVISQVMAEKKAEFDQIKEQGGEPEYIITMMEGTDENGKINKFPVINTMPKKQVPEQPQVEQS